ncbi:hypothetical protein [Haladaptatus salinisoli]|uniref:hypothetical protein n=1 Tax=Haladaptatus salinisoli TaxID=2884876 RepID=UPI001D0A175A|nr:hypothetical protein [Haladaptatus salinisoli]
MYSIQRIGAIAVLGIGFVLITFVPAGLESRATRGLIVGLAIAGGVLLSIGRLWFERIRYSEGEYDERQMAIQYQSGWVVFWILISSIFVIWSIGFFTDMRLPPGAFALLGAGGILLQSASHVLLKRRM